MPAMNSVVNSTQPTQLDPKDIADSIIRNELVRRSDQQGQVLPDIRSLDNSTRMPFDAMQYHRIPLDNPYADQILRQMVGNLRGGKT